MNRFAATIALLSCSATPTVAGDYWEDVVVVLASAPNPIGDYRQDFSRLVAFEDSRTAVETHWQQACEPYLDNSDWIAALSTDVEVHSDPAFQPGYWVVILHSEDDPARALSDARACAPDAYLRSVGVGSPLRHPVCDWACENDAHLYMRFCAVTDFQILMPEAGDNPFNACGISDAEYQRWLPTQELR